MRPCARGRLARGAACLAGTLVLLILSLPSRVGAAVPMGTDRTALEALYDATAGDNWTNNTNWKTDDGDWYGVTTNADGRVTDVDLFENNLVGSLPGALGNLTELESLSLGFNALTGSIPAALGNLSKLENLDVTGNDLTGSIPSALGSLTELKWLFLGLNPMLTGSIPAELGNLSKLEQFDANGCALDGEIPAAVGKPLRTEIFVASGELSVRKHSC